ncbi:UNVERIFIED_CONTAM: ABC transporter permease [Actinomycetes bacterium ARC8]|uniref:ABC transporter permease n=1 Tax=Glutamicibacter nicotianae TaxID=37929 RepID=UPI000578F0D1|nr:ABC transporter permease [Glutamicibacter nicotianae]KWR72205.1 phosphate ABC transporter permease [Arthrobacter sp. W1]MDV2975831.1 ABC transporter permease [Actinomycetes bacterium ARC8]WIV45398.1 ABC transporter permease [Glutamicibacter nicotianae]
MTVAEEADKYGLHRVGARPSLANYLRQTWERREFIYELAKARVQKQNQQNRLGMIWVILKPTLNAVMYGVIFGILQGDKKTADFPVFVVIGVFLFEFFTSSMNGGAKSITGNQALVQSLSFPRLSLPVAQITQNLLTLMPMLIVMFLYSVILGTVPKWTWFGIIPIIAIFTVFNMGVALICARITVHVRDFTQILPLVTRMLFYTSGVLFSVDRILASWPWLVTVFDYHPLYQTLQLARAMIMDNAEYNPFGWLVIGAWAIAALVFGLIFFWKAEERYGRAN